MITLTSIGENYSNNIKRTDEKSHLHVLRVRKISVPGRKTDKCPLTMMCSAFLLFQVGLTWDIWHSLDVCVCVYVCVWERERRGRGAAIEREKDIFTIYKYCYIYNIYMYFRKISNFNKGMHKSYIMENRFAYYIPK